MHTILQRRASDVIGGNPEGRAGFLPMQKKCDNAEAHLIGFGHEARVP
jgi:hypothetical protein